MWPLDAEDAVIEEYRNGYRDELPAAVENAPLLREGLELYWAAFWDLVTCTNINGVIPWTAIDQYARAQRLTVEQAEILNGHVRAMEEEHHDWSKEQSAKKVK